MKSTYFWIIKKPHFIEKIYNWSLLKQIKMTKSIFPIYIKNSLPHRMNKQTLIFYKNIFTRYTNEINKSILY